MDQEELQGVFEDKYEKLLGETFAQWLARAPQSEEAAYARCMEIDRELNKTYDSWFEAKDEEKERLGDYRQKLKTEYDLIEEMFHLEANDRNW
jgi:hypothetical protein